MTQKSFARFLMGLALALTLSASVVFAQMPNHYGAPINLETAKKVAAAAIAEVKKNNWTMAVAIVDTAGDLVYFEKIDGTQTGSVRVSMDKGRSAALFKRPTKAWQDALATGGDGLRVLGLQGAVPVEGGLPLLMDGKIVGAIGVSGGSAAQDGVAAKAGADSLAGPAPR
jgi:glc operon protein GlcG